MSSLELTELVSETIKDLYHLHNYGSSSLEEYEATLRSVLIKISKLLDYQDKLFCKIDIDTSLQGNLRSLNLIGYIRSQGSNEHKETNLLEFIEIYKDSAEHNNSSNVLQQIVDVLVDINKKKPKRIKDSYSSIVVKFSELVEFFLKLHHSAEAELVEFINECLKYELSYYSDLKNGLDVRMKGKDEDTDRIFSFLNKAIETPEDSPNEPKREDESIFSYETDRSFGSYASHQPLKFQTNNTVLSDLYHLFLQILGSRNTNNDDFRGYSKILVDVFKRYSQLNFLEMNSFKYKEMKFNFLYNFLIGEPNESVFSILPASFESINKRVISEVVIFPEMMPEQNLNVNEYQNKQKALLNNPSSPLKMIDKKPSIKPEGDNNAINTQSDFPPEDQVKLINNLYHIIPLLNEFELNFDEKFPSVLRYYISYVYGEFQELATSVDYDYLNEIVNIVNAIVDFENEEETQEFDIKKVVLKFSEIHRVLTPSHKDRRSHSILMRLVLKDYVNNIIIKKRITAKWNLKTLTIGQLDYNRRFHWNPLYRSFLRRRYMKIWFNKLALYANLDAEASFYHSKIIKDSTLRGEWLKKFKRYQKLKHVGINIFKRKFFAIWRNKLQSYNELEHLYESNILKKFTTKFFINWVEKHNSISSLNDSALNMTNQLAQKKQHYLISVVFHTWFNKMNNFDISSKPVQINGAASKLEELSLSDKLIGLAKTEKNFMLSKYWNRWKKIYSYTKVLANVKKNSEANLLQFTFVKKWRRKMQLQNTLMEVISRKNTLYKAKIFEYWLESRNLNEKANNFNRINLLESKLDLWRLRTKEVSIFNVENVDYRLKNMKQRPFFNIWVLNFKLKAAEKRRLNEMLLLYFKQWKEKKRSLEKTNMLSEDFRKSTNICRYYYAWASKYRTVSEKTKLADIKFQEKYISLYKRKFQLYDQTIWNNNSKLKTLPSIEIKILKGSIMKLWQHVYETRYQVNSLSKVTYFERHISQPLTKEKYLAVWVAKFNNKQMVLKALSGRLDVFYTMSASKRHLFNKWSGIAKSCRELESKADIFEIALLYKKFLLIWYDQFINKSVYLNEVAEDFLDQKDIKKIREIIGSWSMKYIKVIRSNAENCEFFRRKWETNKLKSVLELWRYKTGEVNDDSFVVAGDYIDPDSSLGSNPSPLAKKSSKSFNRRPSQNEGSSYLFTPLKQQVKGRTNLITPSISKSSPTKLQETSQRLKSEKIDELRKHFGRARGSTPLPRGMSTPFNVSFNGNNETRIGSTNKKIRSVSGFMDNSKVDINTSGFVKLSPPKSRPHLPSKIPKPPNFDLSKRNVSISSPIDSKISEEDIDEESIIESAKMLRKIKPIIFPSDDGLQEPRFSPVKTLKERLEKNLINLSTSGTTNSVD